jgi:DNA-binding IclR family transcriptional regulator
MNKTTNGASSIRKCLSVLDCFTEDTPRLSLSQTAEKTGFSMPTTLRVLSVLCEEGFLERGEDRLYQPSWKAYRLGRLFDVHDAIGNAILPAMRRLRDATGETVSLYCKHGIHRVCVEQAVSTHELRRSSHPGYPYPLWGGASAKIFLAYMTPDEIERVRLEAPVNRQAVWSDYLARVEAARAQGFAESNAEREEGIASIAAPLFDSRGRLAACLGISGPNFRFTEEARRAATPLLRSECEKLSREHGVALSYSAFVLPEQPRA